MYRKMKLVIRDFNWSFLILKLVIMWVNFNAVN